MLFDKSLLEQLLRDAQTNERLRTNYDLRNSDSDTSQRMLNALQPGTQVPVHCHNNTSESIVCLIGKIEVIFYEQTENAGFRELSRHLLAPDDGVFGIQIPIGQWHTVRVIEPTVIFEAKDGRYVG